MRRLLHDRTVNGLLLGTVLALACTGVAGLFANEAGQHLVFQLHRIGGAAFLVLLVPKAGIIARSLRRYPAAGAGGGRRAGLAVSLLLLLGTLVTVVAALGWSLARGPWRGEWGLPLVVVHWYLALGLLPLFALHAIRHWRAPRRAAFAARRRFLVLGALASISILVWRALEWGATATETAAGRRRFTGSREADWGAPNAFFVTQFLDDDPGGGKPAPLNPEDWRLSVEGRVEQPLALCLAEVQGEAAETATVDCTGGVYATREWRGRQVRSLLDAARPTSDAALV